jgi:hypothetical protein
VSVYQESIIDTLSSVKPKKEFFLQKIFTGLSLPSSWQVEKEEKESFFQNDGRKD